MISIYNILKRRWQEAVMLIGLFAGLSVLAGRMAREFIDTADNVTPLPFLPSFILGVGFMALIILLGMLFLGFLRSVANDPITPRQPVELLQLGRPYFWKVFVFYILFELAWSLLALLIMTLLHGLLYGKVPDEQMPPEWILRLSQLIAIMVLIKPFLLMPSLILLNNRSLSEALVEFRGFSLAKMQLLKIIGFGYGLLLAAFALLYLIPFSESVLWVRIGLWSTVAGSVFLFFFMAVVIQIQEHINTQPADHLGENG